MAIGFSDSLNFAWSYVPSWLSYVPSSVFIVLIASIVERYKTKISKMQEERLSAKDLLQILKEEEADEQNFLKNVNDAKGSIQKVLDIRCSRYKSRKERKLIQIDTKDSMPDEMRYGLENIFEHDYKHCGDTKDEHGELWRVWMGAWRAQAEAKKYRNIVNRLKEKLKE